MNMIFNAFFDLFIFALSVYSSPPSSITNFQNNYACSNSSSLLLNPLSVDNIISAIKNGTGPVKVISYGHSWNSFICPADSDAKLGITFGLGITMTSLEGREIVVDEEALTVTVDAAVKTIDLLNHLSNFVTLRSPSGYTLLAFPWYTFQDPFHKGGIIVSCRYVYQSIGGAVSTGTHGSSILHGSLSQQVVMLEVVLANGSLVAFTPQSDPFLFGALRTSVGQLGIITRLTLNIAKDIPVRRQLRTLNTSSFLELLEEAQSMYLANKSLPVWVDETEFFWSVQRDEFVMVTFHRGDDPDPLIRHPILQSFSPDSTTAFETKAEMIADILMNATMSQLPIKAGSFDGRGGSNLSSASQAYISNLMAQMKQDRMDQWDANQSKCSDLTSGCEWIRPETRSPNAFYALNSSADLLMDASVAGVNLIAGNATSEATQSYLKEPLAYDVLIKSIPYDQYEVSIPMSLVASCFRSLIDLVNSGPTDKGFRTAPLIRFVGQEDSLLSTTNDGPRAFLNIEDYLFYNSGGQVNGRLHDAMGLLRSPDCDGRLHWGKAGWPDEGCWRGEIEYPSTWCDFGCAKQGLDPANRFRDVTKGVWDWEGVDLVGCCKGDGFDKGCECKVTRGTKGCPPSPFYSNR